MRGGTTARCPECGATVARDATDCTRCFRDLRDDPVLLVDGDERVSVSTAAVQLDGHPRRWRELAVVAVAVAVVAGVGLLDDGSGPPAAAETTTTTDRATATTTRRATTTTASTASTTTTTTTWPQYAEGTGPLLFDTGTGSAIGVMDDRGRASVVDLDTGDRCTTDLGSVWFSWPPTSGTPWMVVQGEGTTFAVDRSCTVHELAHPTGGDHGGTTLAATTATAAWLMTDGNEPALRRHAMPSGDYIGPTVDLPPYTAVQVVASGADVVIGAAGDLTLVDVSSGQRRSLGTGTPLAARDGVVAVATCPRLECRLQLVDIETGERTLVAELEVAQWEPAMFSPDGTLLRVSTVGDALYEPQAALVDLATGEVRRVATGVYQPAFTADGEWLIGMRNGAIVTVPTADPQDVATLKTGVDRSVSGLIVFGPAR